MLERASTSAECTAHLFLRRFEHPTRSRRVLGPAFWKQGGDQLDIPAWWPIYLNNIRRRTQDKSIFPESYAPSKLPSKAQQLYEHVQARRSQPHTRRRKQYVGDGARSFTQAIVPSRDSVVATSEIEASLEEADGADNQYDQPDGFAGRVRDGEHQLETRGEPLPQNFSQTASSPGVEASTGDVSYARAWSLFVQSGNKSEVASKLLRFLASSKSRADLTHAMTAFNSIPLHRRTSEDYETVVQVATKLHKYTAAIQTIQEAVSHKLGDSVYYRFMAHCVQNTLWNTLAILWKTLRRAGLEVIRSAKSARTGNISPNSAGRYASHFEDVDDLTDRVVSLANRLQNPDAVIAAQLEPLTEICKRLVYIAVESPKVMSFVTGKGVLALFHVQEQLGFDSKLHLAALATIGRMPDRGAKSSLAMLIYRNYRFASPEARIPAWVYGTLISICSEGHQLPEAYLSILDDFRIMHGRPDDWAFRKAMEACAAQGEADILFKIFEDFCRVSGPKSLYDLNPLIHCFAVLGNTRDAQAQFDRITAEFGLTPDVVSWTSLILAYARSAHREGAMKVFEKMKEAGIRPNAFTWSILMSAAAKVGDTKQARALYDEARDDEQTASLYMIGALVESLLLNHEPKQAEALVLRVSRTTTEKSPVRLWNSLIRYYAFKADSETILRLQYSMKELGIQADGMTYAALMTALVVQRRTADAAKVLRNLRFSRNLNPTEFHYSILIHGFTQEGQRDMATTIYHEMQESFPRTTPGARLAMLRLQLDREESSARISPKSRLQRSVRPLQALEQPVPWLALDYLADTLVAQSPTDFTSKMPNPGFGRRSPREGLNAIYLQMLARFLLSKGADEQAQHMIEQSQLLTPETEQSPAMLIETLTMEMSLAISRQQWRRTSDIWYRILDTGMRIGISITEQQTANQSDIIPEANSQRPQPINQSAVDAGMTEFTSMFGPNVSGQSDEGSRIHILSAQQLILSRALSLYMQALDYQFQHQDIVELVRNVLDQGFRLSSKNWNRYVQVLSKSSNPQHRILAFTTFEEEMLVNTPAWKLLRRGKWLSDSGYVDADANANADENAMREPQGRKRLETLEPSIARPSYFTMIHLATALMKAYRSQSKGDATELIAIRQQAPGTFRKVQRTPHVRDRIQGLLLRGRRLIGDPRPRPRSSTNPTDLSGVRGSKSPLDYIPVEMLETIESIIAPRDNIRGMLKRQSQSVSQVASDDHTPAVGTRLNHHLELAEKRFGKINREAQYLQELDRYENEVELRKRISEERDVKLQPLLELAERLTGEIVRKPIFLGSSGRLENNREMRNRVKWLMAQKLDLLEKIREDGQATQLTSNHYRGEPTIDLPTQQYGMSKTSASSVIKPLAEALLRKEQGDLRQAVMQARQMAKLPGKEHGIDAKSEEEEEPSSLGEDLAVPNTTQPDSVSPSRTVLGMAKASVFVPFNELKRAGPTNTVSSAEWTSEQSYPAIDTRVLTRRIEPRYVQRHTVPPRRYTVERSRRRKAWTINKASRRNKISERQATARRDREAAKLPPSEEVSQVEVDTGTATQRLATQTSDTRGAKLAMSRGARRFK